MSANTGYGYVGPASLLSLYLAGLRLDRRVYAEVSTVSTATHQCLGVTALAAVGYGFAVATWTGTVAPAAILLLILVDFGRLLFETSMAWLVGAKLLGREVGFGGVLRPLALARAPEGLFAVLALSDVLVPLRHVLSIYLLVAFVVAIRASFRCGLPLALGLAAAVFAISRALLAAI